MPIENWLAFSAASIVLVLIPGPTVMLVLSYAISHGRKVAFATASGVALGDFLAMTASLAGLGALVLTSATLFTILKWIGAAYLVFLGVKLFIDPPASAGLEGPGPTPPQDQNLFAHAALVTALNPKSIMFFIAFVPQFVSIDQPIAPQFVILIFTFVSIAAVNTIAYALLADQLRNRIASIGVIQWLSRTGGAALIAMGAATALMRKSTP